MTDRLYPLSIGKLLRWIFTELKRGTVFGIPKELFYHPSPSDPFRMQKYGRLLENPLGAAAGPHTQLAQNIVCAWLCGARYLELKTVQVLDSITVTKPCIDMEDEGYNCEWSQELSLDQSFREYLKAWIIIHILKDHLSLGDKSEPGFIFNMSVGYNFDGIMQPSVQHFLDRMIHCQNELDEELDQVKKIVPHCADLNISSRITDNITLSTMHGCPPDEIEKIAKYLIQTRKLNTAVKLNPTLLGPRQLRRILNEILGFDVDVPDAAFEHDLDFSQAVSLIRGLQQAANESGTAFGVKLTNTLESVNIRKTLPQEEQIHYMSGRALHPVSIASARMLQTEFNGALDISFSAGADAFNTAHILACNIKPITVCTDILKPGGYMRFPQYIDQLRTEFDLKKARTIQQFILGESGLENAQEAGLKNLIQYEQAVLEAPQYLKSAFLYDGIKTDRSLGEYDCISAPCISACAAGQNIPQYMYYTAQGNYAKALEVIRDTNPLPGITGMVCDHLCMSLCTRMNFDAPLLIREIKRFAVENAECPTPVPESPKHPPRVAVIGAGPMGISAASRLARAGYRVTIFEQGDRAGGMVADAIPRFRLKPDTISNDLDLLTEQGVEIRFSHPVLESEFHRLRQEYDYVIISIGAQDSRKLDIPGANLTGVWDQLDFLRSAAQDETLPIGKQVAVIGGGNSAMDAARTALRLAGTDGTVKIIYRRTKKEMPADRHEVTASLAEGIQIMELVLPVEITEGPDGLIMTCRRMKQGPPDDSGRPAPVEVSGSEFQMSVDTIITALGQSVRIGALAGRNPVWDTDGKCIDFPNVFTGGDALRGASSVINAVGDGQRTAEMIIRLDGKNQDESHSLSRTHTPGHELLLKQAKRDFGPGAPRLKTENRYSFLPVTDTLSEAAARAEADRCLLCHEYCSICVSVCPNRANITYETNPSVFPVYQIVLKNEPIITRQADFVIDQTFQILNLGDFCNECGNCTTFCPTSGRPFADKPTLYLSFEGWKNAQQAYRMDGSIMQYKNGKNVESLLKSGKGYEYQSEKIHLVLDSEDYSIKDYRLPDRNANSDEMIDIDTRSAVKMIFLRDIIIHRLPELAAAGSQSGYPGKAYG